MNSTVYLLCKEYVNTMELVYTLTSIDFENHERLKLFRLSQEKLTSLEEELFDTLAEKEFKKYER